MNDYFNIQGFDITHLVNEYRGKRVEDIFQNHHIVSNEMGEFLELVWEIDDFPTDLKLKKAKFGILRNLKTVFNIGERNEMKLKKRGINTINDLKHNLRYNSAASEILNLIKSKNHETLMKNRNICDLDVSFCFNLEDLLFIDIETLGLYDSPMIIVGLGYYKNNRYEIHLLFARNLEEEVSICEHLMTQVLPNFKSFVSYNGKSFDIPFIANRFLYFFDHNPMIANEEMPYKVSNSKFHHIDLYHNCRRKYKHMFESYTLTNMEEKLIGFSRENELPSNLVGTCYKKYLKDPNRYVGLIKECIEHNYFDVYSLPLILKKLL